MNSVVKSPLERGLLQADLVSVIEPWYIRKDTRTEEISVTGGFYQIMANTFVEYYY